MQRLLVVACALLVLNSCKPSPVYDQEFHEAVKSGDIAKVTSMLNKEPGLVNGVDKSGIAPLHVAAGKGNVDMVVLLLGKDGDRELMTHGEASLRPIDLAIGYECVGCIRAFLENGMDVNSKGAYGLRPLHFAVVEEKPNIVRMLLAYGADDALKDNSDRSAFSISQARKTRQITDLFIAKIDWNDPCLRTTECADWGSCSRRGSSCAAGTSIDCELSSACRRFGACSVYDGKCLTCTADDCRKSLIQCRTYGRCGKSDGGCTDKANGCIAVDVLDCKRSLDCRMGGGCSLVDGECSAKSDDDCRASNACKEDGKCKAVGGRCQAI